jgi:hypothetical protein
VRLLEVFGVAAFGALLGASLAWLVDRRKVQIETAFDMHREYFDSLVKARELAVRFIRVHRGEGTLATLWQTENTEDMECIWKIVYFYERLWAALTHRYISRKLVPDLFGDAFNYWYKECFESMLLPIADPIARHIEALYEKMTQLASDDQVDGWHQYQEVWQLGADGTDSPSPE